MKKKYNFFIENAKKEDLMKKNEYFYNKGVNIIWKK